MARTALEHALPAGWPDARASSGIGAVFDEHRERQYSRELLFFTVVVLVALVSLGLHPSLHATARAMETLPVTLAALYDKVNRTEPGILRALVCGSAERLAPVAAAVDGGTTLPGWRLRVLDGNLASLRVGIAITEGTANFLVNRRMNKSQQMRWSRRGADLLLQVRCAIYNGTLGSGFGQRFPPANDPCHKWQSQPDPSSCDSPYAFWLLH